MADKNKHSLSKYIIPIVLTEKEAKLTAEVFKTPEWINNQRARSEATINRLLNQTHRCSAAELEVKRDGCNISLTWEINKRFTHPENIIVSGKAYEISLQPEATKWTGGLIVSARGNGAVRLELEEGVVYYFDFMFVDEDTCNKPDTTIDLNSIQFQVAIPLSDERKLMLRNAVMSNSQSEEGIRHQLDSFISKRAAIDEAREKAIKLIKAKNLSPAEEQDVSETLCLGHN